MCDLSDSADADSLCADELLRTQADNHHRPSVTGYTALHIWNMDKQMVREMLVFQGYFHKEPNFEDSSGIIVQMYMYISLTY